jgi:hypothetical protein
MKSATLSFLQISSKDTLVLFHWNQKVFWIYTCNIISKILALTNNFARISKRQLQPKTKYHKTDNKLDLKHIKGINIK